MSFFQYWQELRRLWQPRRCLVVLGEHPSTHTLGKRLIRDLENDGTAPPAADFLAWRQSAGHGRYGRPWRSPAGAGVYATLVREAKVPIQELPLRVAVAAADTANRCLSADRRCGLKWPNDLLIAGRKVGGVLVDVFSDPDQGPQILVSVGLNVLPSPETSADLASCSLDLAGGAAKLAEVAWDLVGALDAGLAAEENFASGLPNSIVDRYRALSVHQVGDRLDCRVGEETCRGVFRGIDDRGFLRIEVDGSERTLVAGELHD